MKAVFADTFYWAALTSTEDAAHQRALQLSREAAPERIVATDEVLNEYLTFFAGARPSVRALAGDNAAQLIRRSPVIVVLQNRATFMTGLELYRARPDKGYSLTDCISMQVMRREGINDVLTNDRHFEPEGFRALFR